MNDLLNETFKPTFKCLQAKKLYGSEFDLILL